MSEKILVVDDEKEIADLVELYLQNENYSVFKHYTAKGALECVDNNELDLAILDIMLPENVDTHECLLNDKPLSLTPTEFSILRILCEHKGRVVSSEQLFHEIWGDEYFSKGNNTITVHVRHFREKMNDISDNPQYIKTVWGIGYKIELSPELDFVENKLNTVKNTLEKRQLETQQAEQEKNDLVMYLAHDIKTPLTSIIGYLSLSDEIPDMPNEQKSKYVDITLEKAYSLEKMINEFFEITKYNLQNIPLKEKEIDLYYMLVQITDEFYPLIVA